MNKAAMVGALAIGLGLCGAFGQNTLKVGSAAPKLTVAKWVKGTPIKQFDKGKTYVVEFWATWCGPCRTSIPHITELAKKHKGKVEVIGVSIWETRDPKDTSYYATVTDFVAQMGDKMGYTVGVDGPEGTIAKAWMEAAGQNGIPTAFIIDKTGKIAWIGHPMSMDKPLEQIIAGTFDSKAYAKQMEEEEAAQGALMEMMAELGDLVQAGKHQEALNKLGEAEKKHPAMAEQFEMIKLGIMIEGTMEGAADQATKLAAKHKDNAEALNNYAWMMVEEEALTKKHPKAADVALKIAEDAVKLSKEGTSHILDTLAMCWFRKGDIEKAIEWQTKAIEQGTKEKADPELIQEMTERLKMFKSKRTN
ncbi:MAG: redoxin family protein [Armatimonadetes bacterium]|nr:redoxin family protein [Armatimonadota bacterium]